MQRSAIRPGSVFASLLLAVLTVSVFARSQNTGPASTLQRFHESILRRDIGMMQRVLVQPADARSARVLVGNVEFLVRRGIKPKLGAVEQRGTQAIAPVAYVDARNVAVAFVPFAMVRGSAGWEIDADQTLALAGQVGAPF